MGFSVTPMSFRNTQMDIGEQLKSFGDAAISFGKPPSP